MRHLSNVVLGLLLALFIIFIANKVEERFNLDGTPIPVYYTIYLVDGKKIELDKVIVDKCHVILEYPDGNTVWMSMNQIKTVIKKRKNTQQ
jgi:hypothetical protein